jgi:clan AA aspartic protease (TIGR02281 family)
MEYRFDPRLPLIVLYVGLEGKVKATLRMALDTGASYTMIPWDVAETLGYEPALSRRKVDIITASGTEKAPLVILESVTTLGEEARRVDCVVHDLPEASRVDGLLGLSFLRNFAVLIDFRRGILRIN